MRPGALPQQIRQSLTLILLAGGFAYWWQAAGLKSIDHYQVAAIIVAFIVAFVPPFNSAITRTTQRLNAVLALRPIQVGLFTAFFVAAYLLLLAAHNSDSLFPKINDEHAYMIQARMLAIGRLWMPAYPSEIRPFFDALSLISDRVYASMYFPGTAVAELPFLWLHVPFWIMPLVAASASAGLLYSIVAEMFDPIRGLISVLMLVSLQVFSSNSLLLMSEMPFLVAELMMLLAWFRFRQSPKWRWPLILGIAGGFAAITRPLDAVCFAVPIGVAIIFQLRRDPRILLCSAAIILLGALPSLLLLIVQNMGVTGHWNEFAETYFTRENYPAPLMGFHHVNLHYIPAGMSLIKQQWLRDWILPSFQTHTPMNALRSWPHGRLSKIILPAAVPNSLLRILLPLAILSLSDLRKAVILAALAIFVIWNVFYLFLLDHYVVAVFPPIICLILMGWESILHVWSQSNRLTTLAMVAITLFSIEGFWSLPPTDPNSSPDQRPANRLLAQLPLTPAVVLFRFDPRVETFHDDPVYNDGVPFPDDAPVIRARDLGPEKNRDIIRYYAQHQPNRVFYIYDPDARAAGRNPLSPPLGTAGELNVTGIIP